MKMFIQAYTGWRDRRAALSEVQARAAEDEIRSAGLVSSPLHQAIQTLSAGDLEQAAKYWDLARTTMPTEILNSRDTIAILIGLGRLDELEKLMLAGLKMRRRDKLFLRGLAQVAEKRERFLEAAQWWAKFRRCAPSDPDGWYFGAACMHKLGRDVERLAILQKARIQFPHDKDLWTSLAQAREAAGQCQQAVKAWDYVAETLGEVGGYTGGATACEKMGDLQGATYRLKRGQAKHRYNPQILSELARHAERRGNLSEACALWEDVQMACPQLEIGFRERIRCLKLASQEETAAVVTQDAMKRFPGQFAPSVNSAVAEREFNHPAAPPTTRK